MSIPPSTTPETTAIAAHPGPSVHNDWLKQRLHGRNNWRFGLLMVIAVVVGAACLVAENPVVTVEKTTVKVTIPEVFDSGRPWPTHFGRPPQIIQTAYLDASDAEGTPNGATGSAEPWPLPPPSEQEVESPRLHPPTGSFASTETPEASQNFTTPSQGSEPVYVLRFQNAPWNIVLRRFTMDAGLALQMEFSPPGTFTYTDETPHTVTAALDILNDQLLRNGCLLIRRERSIILVSLEQKIPDTLIPQITPADLPHLGRNELAGLVISVESGTAATVAKEVEQLLTKIGGVFPLTNSNRLFITDIGGNLRRIHHLLMTSSGDSRRPSFVYRLKHTAAVDVAAAVSELLTGRAGRPSQPPGGVNGASPFQAPIQPVSFQESRSDPSAFSMQVVPEPSTNSVLICGSQAEIDEACRIISELDACPAQVLIQALLVEVELGNTDEFGVELGVQDSVLFDRSVINNLVTLAQTTTSPNGVQTTNQQVLSQTSEPGFNFNNKPLGNNTSVNPGRIGSQGLSNLGVGRINGDLGFGGLVLSAGSESVNVLIRALSAKYKVDVLSRPQITTLDNQPAHIQIGQQVPVIDGVTVTPVGSASPVVRQDQAGIILKVTPRIGPEGIVVSVVAEKSQFQTAPGTGVPIYTDVTNGNVIEAPIKDITTAQTMVGVDDGQCIALGGMITKSLQVVERKVPLLGDIPLVGRLFRYDQQSKKRKELLIFLTPHIVRDAELPEHLKETEVARMHFPMEAAEQMHGPMFRTRGDAGPATELTEVAQGGQPLPPLATVTPLEETDLAPPNVASPPYGRRRRWKEYKWEGTAPPETPPTLTPHTPAPGYPPSQPNPATSQYNLPIGAVPVAQPGPPLSAISPETRGFSSSDPVAPKGFGPLFRTKPKSPSPVIQPAPPTSFSTMPVRPGYGYRSAPPVTNRARTLSR